MHLQQQMPSSVSVANLLDCTSCSSTDGRLFIHSAPWNVYVISRDLQDLQFRYDLEEIRMCEGLRIDDHFSFCNINNSPSFNKYLSCVRHESLLHHLCDFSFSGHCRTIPNDKSTRHPLKKKWVPKKLTVPTQNVLLKGRGPSGWNEDEPLLRVLIERIERFLLFIYQRDTFVTGSPRVSGGPAAWHTLRMGE